MNNAFKNRQANKNHYICSVVDIINPGTVYSCYFDGTQVQAIKHFKGLDKIKKYLKFKDSYVIHISANSLTIGFDC